CFCSRWPGNGEWTTTRAPFAVASSRVASVLPLSTTTTSSQKSSERTQSTMRSASWNAITQADTGVGRPGSLMHVLCTACDLPARARDVAFDLDDLALQLRDSLLPLVELAVAVDGARSGFENPIAFRRLDLQLLLDEELVRVVQDLLPAQRL